MFRLHYVCVDIAFDINVRIKHLYVSTAHDAFAGNRPSSIS